MDIIRQTVQAPGINAVYDYVTAYNFTQLRQSVSSGGRVGVVVYVLGATTPGDGGQGAFRYAAVVNPTDDSLNTIVPGYPSGPSPTNAWLRVDPIAHLTPNPVTRVSGNYTVLPTDSYLAVNSSGGAYTITLDTGFVPSSGSALYVKDQSGNAGTNNITLASSHSYTFDGGVGLVLNGPYSVVRLTFDNSNYMISG